MTETTSERPLTVATLESILEQLGKNLRLLNAAENQAALARGNRYRFIPSHSEKPERQAQIDAAQAEVDRFEKLVATLLKKSQGCARQLNRQTVIVTGPLIKEHRFWSGGIPGLIGSGHYETETYEIFVRDLKHRPRRRARHLRPLRQGHHARVRPHPCDHLGCGDFYCSIHALVLKPVLVSSDSV
jgi:hypothetical protein